MASDLRKIIEAQQLGEEEDVEILIKTRTLFSTELGQEVLNDLKRRFGWLRPNYGAGDTSDSALPIVREGQKQVLYHIEWTLLTDPRSIRTKNQKQSKRPGEVEHHGRVSTKQRSDDLGS